MSPVISEVSTNEKVLRRLIARWKKNEDIRAKAVLLVQKHMLKKGKKQG